MVTQEEIREVYKMLKEREIHPSGKYDGKRWHAKHQDLVGHIRKPSRNWPWSEMVACRTLKYTKKVAAKFQCKNKDELVKMV